MEHGTMMCVHRCMCMCSVCTYVVCVHNLPALNFYDLLILKPNTNITQGPNLDTTLPYFFQDYERL
jgi:hypothetical protein